jgi:PiT family inorganic phosphate transporter
MWQLSSGIFLGWSLGANDASNVFGTAVASRMVKFTTAAALCSLFVVAGALLEGQGGIRTYQQLSPMSPNLAFIVGLSAGATVTLMSFWRLPVSTSQAVVGALVLIGLLRSNLDTSSLLKVVLCWVGTPIGAAVATVVLYYSVGKLLNLLYPTLFMFDRGLRWSLILAGSYGAYALGANNVANVTGAFAGPGMLTPFQACLIGSLAIALGVLTSSPRRSPCMSTPSSAYRSPPARPSSAPCWASASSRAPAPFRPRLSGRSSSAGSAPRPSPPGWPTACFNCSWC